MAPEPDVEAHVRAMNERRPRGVRGRLVEAHRRRLYGHPSPLSSWRRRIWKLRHQHGEIIFEGPVSIGPRCSIWMPAPATLRIGANVEFRRGIHLEIGPYSELTIGEGTIFTYNAVIQTVRSITIGKRCMIGTGVEITDARHNFRGLDPDIEPQGLVFEPVVIGDDVLVNVKATITANVGDRAVIGAHAVVTRPIPPSTLAVGMPAKPVDRLSSTTKEAGGEAATGP